MKKCFTLTTRNSLVLFAEDGVTPENTPEINSAILRDVTFKVVEGRTVGIFDTATSELNFQPSLNKPIIRIENARKLQVAKGSYDNLLNGLEGAEFKYFCAVPSMGIILGDAIDFEAEPRADDYLDILEQLKKALEIEPNKEQESGDKNPDPMFNVLEKIFGKGNVASVPLEKVDPSELTGLPKTEPVNGAESPREIFQGSLIGKTYSGDAILQNKNEELYLLPNGSKKVTPITY